MSKPEPYFDIVDVTMPRDDFWADLARAFGYNLTVTVPQMKWRPGGQERMVRDQQAQMAAMYRVVTTGRQ
jgi:hypothetical protein